VSSQFIVDLGVVFFDSPDSFSGVLLMLLDADGILEGVEALMEGGEEAVNGSELAPFHEEVHEEEGVLDGDFVVLVETAVAHVGGVHAAREERDNLANSHEDDPGSVEVTKESSPHDAHVYQLPSVDAGKRDENNADKVGDNVQPNVDGLADTPCGVEVCIPAVLTVSVEGFAFSVTTDKVVELRVVLL
jgi:hypothetical protein